VAREKRRKNTKLIMKEFIFLKTFNNEEVFMFLIKSLLTGLAGVSLCMADISGTVTDTSGTTPIPGAVVQLETGGQIDTTDASGNFTLVTSTAIVSNNGNKSLLNGLSARISGNVLNLTIAEQSAVEVTTFDLNGKAISTMHKTLNAGSQSMALPQRSAGIYLYKVRAGNKELALKGNSVDGVSSGNIVSSQASSSTPLAKQATATVANNDVIAVTKDGLLIYRVVVTNSDTSGIAIKMIASAGTVTDADGNVYQTVQIGTQVWTVENLLVTKYNDGSDIPLDMSATWSDATTPKYCFFNNTTNADSIKKFGALYNWHVVNTGKLAPTGWHVPTDSEWTVMEKYMVLHGYNYDGTTDTAKDNAIAKSLAAKTDWYTNTTKSAIGCDLAENNSSGFSALPGGFRNHYGAFDNYQSSYGVWWCATEDYNEVSASTAWTRNLYSGNGSLCRYTGYKSSGISVRLLRD
jgi:uncharacterized protein (TIGR02145 family)